jgi:hypothetical protein
MNTFYDARTGALYAFDAENKSIVKRPITYADTNKHPGEIPFLPDIEWQEKFRKAFFEALEEVKKTANYKFVVDADTNGNNKAEGFLHGDLTFIYVREDKFGYANYRVECKASLIVPEFYKDQRNGMKNRIIQMFLDVDKKREG